MEGEAIVAVIPVVLQNLIDLIKSEISLIRGLRSDAEKLADSLDTIQNYLNGAQNRSLPDEDVKSWLRRLENAAFEADNILDEFSYHILSIKIKSIKPFKEKVRSKFSHFKSISRHHRMAHRIKEINQNFASINKGAHDLQLVERFTNSPTLNDAAFRTDAFAFDPIFIGRDDVLSEIVEILTGISIDKREISILAIVGMGGLGKTTLVRNVFHHQMVNTRFGTLIWIHVSQTFDPIILFKKILKDLAPNQHVDVENRQDLLKKLQQALKDKIYLLVLDDLWNQDIIIWEDFMNSLSGVTSTKGNAIVVTTRIVEVASVVNPFHVHQLKGLSEEDCWSVIREKTFRKDEVPSNFETIGRNIAIRCGGLPLAAIVVAGVIRNQSHEKWLLVEKKWLSYNEGGRFTNTLRLSFNNLYPPSLKKCFAYCSIFPRNMEIDMQILIECWMAEGLLQADESDDLESVAEKYINILLNNSLLQVSKRDDNGNIKSCVMHDLVHYLACSCNNGTCRGRYMVALNGESSSIPKEAAKYLRTLFFQGDTSTTMFSDLESLHVLSFVSYVKELPKSIRKLIHLRKLDIQDTVMKQLPDWIGKLSHLQTLRADSVHMTNLPSTLRCLINLRHLYISPYAELPAGIGRLTSLRTLEHFRVGDNSGCKLEELGSLNNLKGSLSIYNLERVHNKEEAREANLFRKSKILELCLQWESYRERERNDKEVLEGLEPHFDLKKLKIVGFSGKSFPFWTLEMAVRDRPQGSWVVLDKLTSVSLFECKECEEVPTLGHLPNLKSLGLRKLSNLKSINSSFYGLANEEETVIFFPALERLELAHVPKLAEWTEAEFLGASQVKVFPRLQHLEMTRCQQLMTAPSHFPSHLEHLEIRGIGSYKPLASILEAKFTLLKELHLVEMECLPDWLFYNNPNLWELKIIKCPNLRELPNGLCSLSSL